MQGQTKTFLIQLGNISEKLGYGRDYFDFIDEAAEEMDAGEGRREPIQKIEFKDVQFMYPKSVKKALEDLNITIHRGEKIAVVGENGSGKTTLTKLLLGMYDPCQGEIQVNGEDLLRRGKEDYQKRVSMISQQFVRYQMTLRENVAMSDLVRRGEDGQIEEALKSAGLEADFDAAALDTLLGTQFGSVDLSGGQWQRVAIARGIFRASEVIVMDEPTSAIDPIAEAEIFKKFLKIAEGKTAVIVSHRTGLCTMVDKIAVMKEGRLVEYGSHETLLGMDGEYARLFYAQRQWYV